MSDDRLDSLIEAADALYSHHAAGSSYERDAAEAAANTLSAYGTPGMDNDVVTALEHAIEVGYVLALDDVREGRVEVES